MDQAIPAPTPTAFQVCSGVVDEWKLDHCPSGSFDQEVRMVTARVPSWIAPRSVLAGVVDVFSSVRVEGHPLPAEVLSNLGDRLAHRLAEEGMLSAQPRRAGLLQPAG